MRRRQAAARPQPQVRAPISLFSSAARPRCGVRVPSISVNGAYVMDLGKVEYEAAWELQRSLAAAVSLGAIPDTVLFLEHPPTITLGRRGAAGTIPASTSSRSTLRLGT